MKKSVLESYQKAIQSQVSNNLAAQDDLLPVDEIGFSEYNISAPIKPEENVWEILPNPERYYREYEFDSFGQIHSFLEMCFGIHDEISQTIYINYRIQKVGRIGFLSVEVGEGVLVEEERIVTQILDQIYGMIIEPIEQVQSPLFYLYDDDEDFEFEDFQEQEDYE